MTRVVGFTGTRRGLTVEQRITLRRMLERNHRIVDRSDFLIACPGEPDEQLRSGTWATVRYARRSGKRVWLVLPSGEVRGP